MAALLAAAVDDARAVRPPMLGLLTDGRSEILCAFEGIVGDVVHPRAGDGMGGIQVAEVGRGRVILALHWVSGSTAAGSCVARKEVVQIPARPHITLGMADGNPPPRKPGHTHLSWKISCQDGDFSACSAPVAQPIFRGAVIQIKNVRRILHPHMKAPFVLLICVFTGFFAACQQKPSSPEERSEPLAFSPTDPVQTSRWLMDVLKPFEAANESQNELKWAESAKNLLSSLRPFEEAEVIWPFTVVSVSPSGIAASLRIPDEAHDKVIVHNSKGAKHTWHDEILITAPAEKLKELNRGDTIRAKGRLKFETRGPWVAGVVVVIESFSLTP